MKEQPDAAVTAQLSYCVIRVAGEEFFLPVEPVREVIELSPLFRVLLAPDYLHGVVPLRGRIIPAVDLSKIFPVGAPRYDDAKLIIVDVKNEALGFMSEGLPYFTSSETAVPGDRVIDIEGFFEKYRIREMADGKI